MLQSTLPHGERRNGSTTWPRPGVRFNPRSRTGSDLGWMPRPTTPWPLQSTLPHGERRDRRRHGRDRDLASIHAPARGATQVADKMSKILAASIHAPARGATLRERRARPPQGASIHAPARGATTSGTAERVAQDASIHAPARGATRSTGVGCPWTGLQSTLPHGERHPQSPNRRQELRFNPRSRTGSDPSGVRGA